MKRSRVCLGLSAALFTAGLAAQAQAPASGPAVEAQKYYAGVKKNILASADKMPADGYGFKPEPDVRNFARVLDHVIEAQFHSCGAFNGTDQKTLPKVPSDTATKEEVITALQASFAECDKAFAALTDANLSEMVQVGPAGKRSRIGLLWGTSAHDNEQYAALAMYLRLKGVMPPSMEH
jgi:hypothetical protein